MATERNDNQVPTLIAKSNAADNANVIVWADPTTRRLLVDVSGGGTSMTDDAAFTPATTAGTPAFAMFDDVTPDSVNEGDGGILRMSANRNLYVNIRDNAGNERGLNIDASGNISIAANQSVNVAQINGVTTLMGNGITGTGSQRVTIASDNTAFAVNATLSAETTKVIGTVNIAAAQTIGLATGSSTIGALTANQSVNVAQVNGVTVLMGNGVTGTGSQRVTIASDNTAFAVNATLSAETTKVIGTVNVAAAQTIAVTQATASSLNAAVVGEVAHDGVDSGNPQKIGGIADDTLPAAVGDLDRVNRWHDRHGRAHSRSGHQSAAPNVWTAIHVPAANTQATISKAAAGVGVRNIVTALTVSLAATATAPTAVNVTANLIDGATGGTTYLWRMTMSLPATAGQMSGVQKSDCWLPGTANTATTLEFSAAGGANTIESVSMEGITITE